MQTDHLNKLELQPNTKPFYVCSVVINWVFAVCSLQTAGQATSSNGLASAGVSKPQSSSPISSASPSQPGKDYDFSSLTQGMFSKHWGDQTLSFRLNLWGKKETEELTVASSSTWDCTLLCRGRLGFPFTSGGIVWVGLEGNKSKLAAIWNILLPAILNFVHIWFNSYTEKGIT